MADVSSAVFPSQLPDSLDPIEAPLPPRKWPALVETAIGFALITATVWSSRLEQRTLLWISAAWFICFAVVGYRRSRANFRLPSVKISLSIIGGGLLIAVGLIASAAAMGTLHGLFGVR